MLNGLLVVLVLASVLVAAFTGRMDAVSTVSLDAARQAVDLTIGLVGVMTLFLGLMRVASDGGALRILSRWLAPLFRRLFPDVPSDHPALGAMVLNVASTMLGLGNAATPFGIRAMTELERLNTRPGTATNAMILFLAVNTAGFSVLPTSILAVRAAAGSKDPAGILVPVWIASGCATLVGIAAAVLLSRLPRYRRSAPPSRAEGEQDPHEPASPEISPAGTDPIATPPRWGVRVAALCGLAFVTALALHVGRGLESRSAWELLREVLSYWILPALIGGLVLFGWVRGVRVFASLVEGGKEGFQVALKILPYLVAILVAIGMLRASGGLELFVRLLDPITRIIGMPAEALPVAILRPLTGSGAFGVMAEVIQTHGADSFIGYLVSTLQGSTETTFYVLAVYFGAVGVKKTRHALPACLLADAAGILTALLIVHVMFG
jgi:spore maturation protein SpmA